MKLWILRPVKKSLRVAGRLERDPWDPWYDKAFGFVVRAESESGARLLAHAGAGDENSYPQAGSPWLEENYSSCEELGPDGKAGIVIRDFKAA